MAMPDVVAAVVSFLKADATVAAASGGRVFGWELPRAETDAMPRPCIVVKASGGAPAYRLARVPLDDTLIDFRCFGADLVGAMAVYTALHPALKLMQRHVEGDVLLYDAKPAIKATQLREPDTDWPFVFTSYHVLAAEREAV